jgi:hypothetical protein
VCAPDPTEWNQRQAADGDPVAQYLQSQRAHMVPRAAAGAAQHGTAASARAKAPRAARAELLRMSALGGFSRAQVSD